ncbi:hypothetical protein cypCar_00044242, partial [Cyprinus carpio]
LLTYERSPPLPFLSHAVQCVYDLPGSSAEEEDDEDDGAVTFSLELMNTSADVVQVTSALRLRPCTSGWAPFFPFRSRGGVHGAAGRSGST